VTPSPIHFKHVFRNLRISKVFVWDAIVVATISRRDCSRARTGDLDNVSELLQEDEKDDTYEQSDNARGDSPLEAEHRHFLVSDLAVVLGKIYMVEGPVCESHEDR
jgi:hypothetical protein